MDKYDVIIVGSGPAGLTAAIYAGRQNLKTLVLEKGFIGGMGSMVPSMENYPGFERISGKQLIDLMKNQTLNYAEIKDREDVKKVEFIDDGEMMVHTNHTKNSTYQARAVILATGSQHRHLEVLGEGKFLGKGVAYCATCDGPLFIGRKVLVAGGGNGAVQQAIYLDDIGVFVAMAHRRGELRAEKYLQELLEERKIPIFWNSTIEEIRGDMAVKSVLLNNIVTGEQTDLPIDGVFIAVGEIPANQLAIDLGVELDKRGYIITDEAQKTNIPGVYAAGDITGGFNQWVIACSEGAIAALSAYEHLLMKK